MSAPFHRIQAALIAAATALDSRGEFSLDDVLDDVRKHNAALLDGLTTAEAFAAAEMTLERMPIADGALGWLQLNFVATSRGHLPHDESAEAEMRRLMRAHPEVGLAKWPVLDAFEKWMDWYFEEQQRQLAETERQLAVMEETGAPTLGKAIEQATNGIIARAKGFA